MSVKTEKFSGADWLKKYLSYEKSKVEISPLGIEAANILGQVFKGIYHIQKDLEPNRVNWADTHCIQIRICADLATYDFAELTVLVLLAHKRKVRVEIGARSRGVLEIMFSYQPKHLSIEQSIARFAPWVDVDFDDEE